MTKKTVIKNESKILCYNHVKCDMINDTQYLKLHKKGMNLDDL